MNYDVVLTCAVTGAGDTTGKSPHVPVTPKEIAHAAIEAAKAGASAAHIHARNPETGQGSRDPKLFKEIAQGAGRQEVPPGARRHRPREG